MIIKAKKAFPKLKNIIIIFDPFLWGRDFSYQGYIDTVPSIVDMIKIRTLVGDIISQYLVTTFNYFSTGKRNTKGSG